MNKRPHVGLDVHKDTIAIAFAEDGRGGEIRFCCTFPIQPHALLTRPIAAEVSDALPTQVRRMADSGCSIK